MNDRPFILKGIIKLNKECIIGKIIKNDNVEDKEKYIQVLDNEHINLFEKGYRAYIFQDYPKDINIENTNYCYNIKDYDTLLSYDVVEIIDNIYVKVLYRNDSEDNAIVVTNQCNSNCIMCPDSDIVRKDRYNVGIDKLIELVRCIPDDTKHITITGGEPGLLKHDLVLLLKECKECLPNTEFLLLSNGRVFANTEYVNDIVNNLPEKIRFGIPLYADNAKLHDSITRAKGSFNQTLIGIKKLLARKVDIEIRIVAMKKNYMFLENIAEFITKEIPMVKMVNIMALEMLGNSYKNRDDVWVNFTDMQEVLYNACIKLISDGIITNLYNFPLCNLDKRLYSLNNNSITDYKVRFKDECEGCKAKDICGGFFFSTINRKDIKVYPIK